MDIEQMLGSVIEGALSGRRKKGRGALRFLRGARGRGGSSFLNGSTLLTLAGVAWGIYETAMKSPSTGSATGAPGGTPGWAPPPPPLPPPTTAPLPAQDPATRSSVVPPPLPAAGAPASGVPQGVARVIRLTLAAARADGTLTDRERESILSHAERAGAMSIVEDELRDPAPLSKVVDGVADRQQRRDLYTLAFSIVRADEAVSEAERAWLAELASALVLDDAETAELEETAAVRISAAAREPAADN